MPKSSLCVKLGAEQAAEKLRGLFIQDYKIEEIKDYNRALREIKIFLHRHKKEIRELLAGETINSTDCLSLAVKASLLGDSIGFPTTIARPSQLTKYFHAVLVYGEGQIFQIAGSSTKYERVIRMSDEEIFTRLRYTRPLVNAVNFIRGRR